MEQAPSVRVGRWVLRQGGPLYRRAVIGFTVLLLLGAAAAMPHTLLVAAALLRARCGFVLPLVLLVSMLPVIALHEGTHIAVFAAARLPVRLRLGRMAITTEVPVALPRRVALASALAPQPAVLGALALAARFVPAAWPLLTVLGVLAVAGSSADLLAAAAMAVSRDSKVLLR
jgi:hypothetical protein